MVGVESKSEPSELAFLLILRDCNEERGDALGREEESLGPSPTAIVEDDDGEEERLDADTDELGGREVVLPRSDPPIGGVRYPPWSSEPVLNGE